MSLSEEEDTERSQVKGHQDFDNPKHHNGHLNKMGKSPFFVTDSTGPEDICIDIASFQNRPQTRSRRLVEKHGEARHVQSNIGTLQDEGSEVPPNNTSNHEKLQIRTGWQTDDHQNYQQKEDHSNSRQREKHIREKKLNAMHIILNETTTDLLMGDTRLGSRREIGLRKRQARSQDVDSKRFSPMPSIHSHNNVVPRLHIPADITADRENTLVGLSRSPREPRSSTTPDNSSRSYHSDKGRNKFGRKPCDVTDPLEDILINAPVSERKYSILPSIGTPLMMPKAKGGDSHRNQLDYARDRYESDAEFFSEYHCNVNPKELTGRRSPVPLPPIQLGAGSRTASQINRSRQGSESER